jgi:hypothetical protein
MTDTLSPTTQFHPYTPPDAVPVAERKHGPIRRSLARVGIDPDRLVGRTNRATAWARRHPGAIVGGLAAAVVGTALLRSRLSKAPGNRSPAMPPSEI